MGVVCLLLGRSLHVRIIVVNWESLLRFACGEKHEVKTVSLIPFKALKVVLSRNCNGLLLFMCSNEGQLKLVEVPAD